MTEYKCMKYRCNYCGEQYDGFLGLICIPEINLIAKPIQTYWDLHFCIRRCMAKWAVENLIRK